MTAKVVPLRPRPAPSRDPMTAGQLRRALATVPADAVGMTAGGGTVTRATRKQVQELDGDRRPIGPAHIRVMLR